MRVSIPVVWAYTLECVCIYVAILNSLFVLCVIEGKKCKVYASAL